MLSICLQQFDKLKKSVFKDRKRKFLASSAFGQVKMNFLHMFDAKSFNNIEGSLTKNLKKETKDHQTMPQQSGVEYFLIQHFRYLINQSSSNKYIYRVKSKHKYMKIEFQLGFRIFFTLSYCSVCALVKESPQFLSSTKRHGMVFYGQIVVSFIMLKDYSLPFLRHQTYILPCEQIKKI